ncbi:MAG: NAD-dependent epimerase/dehydratase family protein [bacterium]
MTKVLITGATGFIGRAVADAANKRGMDLRLMVRNDKFLDQVKHIKFEKVYGDLTDPESLQAACRGVDAVFHVAALYTMWVRDADLLLKTNVEGTKAMIKAALDSGCQKFVYTSSVAAIGHRDDGQPSDETVEWNLEWTGDAYTKSKHLSCEAVKEFIRDGAPIIIAYPGAPVGWGDVKPTPTSQMYVDFINGKIPVYFDGGFSVIDVDDCGEGHLLAFEKGRIGEGYILTNKNMPLKELYDLTAEIAEVPRVKIRLTKGQAYLSGDFMEWVANNITHATPILTHGGARMTGLPPFFTNKKAVEELGLKFRPIRETFERAIEYYASRGWLKRGKYAKMKSR